MPFYIEPDHGAGDGRTQGHEHQCPAQSLLRVELYELTDHVQYQKDDPGIQESPGAQCDAEDDHAQTQQTELQVGDFIWTGGVAHLYLNHLEQAKMQLTRKPYPLPRLVIKRKAESIFTYEFTDFEIADYTAHPHIKAPVAV